MFSRCHCPVITECSGLWINNKFLTKSFQCFRRHEKLPDLLLLNLCDLAFTPSGTVAWLFLHMYIYYIFQSTRPPFFFFRVTNVMPWGVLKSQTYYLWCHSRSFFQSHADNWGNIESVALLRWFFFFFGPIQNNAIFQILSFLAFFSLSFFKTTSCLCV